MDHLSLAALDHALAGAHIDEGPQLFLAEHRLFGAPSAHDLHHQRGQPRQRGPSRCQDHTEPGHRPPGDSEELLRVLDGQSHRQDFTEGREHEDQHDDLHEQAEGRTEDTVGDRRGQRGGADIDHGDADEQGDEQLVRALDERLWRAHRLVFVLRGDVLEPGAAQREVGGFGAREDRGADDQRAQREELQAEPLRHGRAPSRSARTPGGPTRHALRRRDTGSPRRPASSGPPR